MKEPCSWNIVNIHVDVPVFLFSNYQFVPPSIHTITGFVCKNVTKQKPLKFKEHIKLNETIEHINVHIYTVRNSYTPKNPQRRQYKKNAANCTTTKNPQGCFCLNHPRAPSSKPDFEVRRRLFGTRGKGPFGKVPSGNQHGTKGTLISME